MDGDDDKVVRLDQIRSLGEQAEELSAIDPPAPGSGSGADRPAQPRRDGMPDDCPILALGRDKQTFHYLSPARQVISIAGGRHTKGEMQALFAGRHQYLQDKWPRYSSRTDERGRPIVNGISYDKCSMTLMDACARMGIWNPADKERGPGWWHGEDGELIAHCGHTLGVISSAGRETWVRPGVMGEYVYSAAPRRAIPAPGPIGTAEVEEVLELIRTWKWTRPSVEPLLLLGWIGCAMLGAAIEWRPVVWITGGSGTGKSALHDYVLKPLFGLDGAVAVSDPTEAGLRQSLRQSSLPAIVDELEPRADNRKVDTIIQLARYAASGAQTRRGGQDHNQIIFELRSAFAFQSILIPPLLPQDRNRMAVLDLEPLGDRRAPAFDRKRISHIGACMRRRLVQAWPRLPATIERYQNEMRAHGAFAMDSRGSDVYGALAGVAELLLFDDPAEADGVFRELPEKLRISVHQERQDGSEEMEFLNYLLSLSVETSRGAQPKTIAELIRQASDGTADADDKFRARRTLGLHGLCVAAINPDMPDALGVVIANRSSGLARLLSGTHWTAGAGKSPPWVQIAKRLAQANKGAATPSRAFSFAGFKSRGAWIPVSVFLPEGGEGG